MRPLKSVQPKNYVLHHAGHSSSWYLMTEETSIFPIASYASALERTNVHFSLIVFDSCLMSMLEPQYQLRFVTDYILSCETYSPWQGFISAQLLTTMSESNSTSSVGKYESILNDFIQRNLEGPYVSDATLTSTARLEDLANFVMSINLTQGDFQGHRPAKLDLEDGTFDLWQVVMSLPRLTSNQKDTFTTLFREVVIYYQQNELSSNYNEHHFGLSVCRDPMMNYNDWAYYLLELQPVSVC